MEGKVITVRLPVELHEQAKAEARSLGLSLNCWCIAAIESQLETKREETAK